jgi:hypothetical protein
MTRSLDELTSAESSWQEVLDLVEHSDLDAVIAPTDLASRTRALLDVQVTTHSLLGAIAWNCGVIAIDHGWVRLLGGGVGGLRGVHVETLNDVPAGRTFQGVTVAFDVMGGRFAIHGGGLEEVPLGEVVYWAPDSLSWMPLELSHSAFVQFLFSDRLAAFYQDLRWPGWERDSEAVPLDRGLAAYPFPWSEEGQGPGVSRKPVPMAELVALAEEAADQLRDG